MPANPIASRAWLERTLADAGKKLEALNALGVDTTSPVTWTDADDVALQMTRNGDGITLTATPSSGQDPWTWKFPATWTAAP